MTSFTCTSRQARTHRVQWMQASSATRMAGWLASGAGASRAGNRLPVTSSRSAHCHRRDRESCAASRRGWSAISSSSTIPRAFRALSLPVLTVMPEVGRRMHEAASARSPSTSTMQARQLPSGR